MALRPLILLAALVAAPGPASARAGGDCDAGEPARARWQALKAAGFTLDDAGSRQAEAMALAACLGHPDPSLRDGLAYEALATWLRADALDADTRRRLRDVLLPGLRDADPPGFRAPFAALVLAEVARTDRVSPWLSAGEREALVDAATTYVAGVRDYRGFIDGEGWRHGLAHGADFLMQLALNPALERGSLDAILEAVSSQAAPPGAPAHVHGEAERLVRPVLFVLRRGLHDDADWAAWVRRVADPAPLPAWSAAYGAEATLARRHNLRAFLLALHVALAESGDPALAARTGPVREALAASQ